MDHYILVGHEPAKVDFMTWVREFGDIEKRRVAETVIDDDTWVSTVFLGADHRFADDGPPILFETMIFRDGDGQECWRHCTWGAAEVGHKQVVAALRAGTAPEPGGTS